MALEESLYDNVVDILKERQKLVKEELRRRFKRTKPFRMEPMDSAEALYYYNQITPEQMNSLVQNYGRESVNEMVYQMETLKQKKGVK